MDLLVLISNGLPLFLSMIALVSLSVMIVKHKGGAIFKILISFKIVLILFYMVLESQWIEGGLGVSLEKKDDVYSDMKWALLESSAFISSALYVYFSMVVINNKVEMKASESLNKILSSPKMLTVFIGGCLLFLWSIIAVIEISVFGESKFVELIIKMIDKI